MLTAPDSPSILIVDDNPVNLEVLSVILNQAGYQVRVEIDGINALEHVRLHPPDLILLDVMMPEADGFAVCEQLKNDPLSQAIPIIFISALDSAQAKVKGFKLGAVDYISKPFQQEEILARVELHLQLRHLQKTLEQQNLQLKDLSENLEKQVARRTKALTRSLDDLEKTQTQLAEANTKLKNHARYLELQVSIRAQSLKQEIQQRKQVEQALRESEERFRLMANSAPVLLWMADVNGECSFFNQRWFEFTGHDSEDAIENIWIESLHPDDRAAAVEIYLSAFNQRIDFKMEYRLKRADGQYRWVVDTGIPRFFSDGSFAGYIGSCADIHDRKQAEQALSESEAKFRRLVENANDMIYSVSPEGTFTYFSPKIKDILGYEPSEVIGQAFAFLTHPEDMLSVQKLHQYTLAAEKNMNGAEIRVPHKDGSYCWIMLNNSPIKDEHGRIVAYDGIARDITERKQAEAALELSQFCLDNSMESIAWIDSQGRFLYVNAALCRSLEYSKEELLSMRVLDIDPFFSSEAVWLNFWQTLKQKGFCVLETYPRSKGGRIFPIEISATYAKFRGQEYVCSFSRDISDRKRNEAERKQVEIALRNSEQRFRQLFDDAPLAMGILDLETLQILIANQAACQLFQYTPDEITCLNSRELVYPDDRSLDRKAIERLMSSKMAKIEQEKRYLKKNGEIIWGSLTATLIRDSDDNALYLLLMLKDITERKLAEEGVYRSQQILQDCFENAPIGLQWIGEDGTILWANHAQLKMLGFTKDEYDRYIGHHLAEFHCDRDSLDNLLKQLAEKGSLSNCEAKLRCKDGSTRYVEMNSNVLWEKNRFLHTRCFVNDISDRKQAEEQLRASLQEREILLKYDSY
jgi:PAS domain S-box-containing protein